MIKFEDTTIEFNKNINGYYRVGDKYFYKKYNAVLESANTKLPLSWDFHRNIFEHTISKKNLDLNLLNLYKIRAQQLRDMYDYIILAYSGGSDSHNILKTFLNNNIKLDEIWSDFPKSLIEKSNYVLTNSQDPDNMAAEMYTIVIPELKEIGNQYPNIKIHFSDNWENGYIEDYEDTFSIVNIPSSYLLVQRYRYIMNYAAKLADQGKKVAIIKGIDKPIPYVKDNSYGILFSDKATYYKSSIIHGNYIAMEYFYWSPMFPDVAVAQAKNLWNYLLQSKHETTVMLLNQRLDTADTLNRTIGFDNIIKKICFPYWDFSRLQTNKSSHLFNKNYLHFIEKHKNEKKYQSYLSHLVNIKKIPKMFLDGNNDIKFNYSFFKLGDF